MVYDIKGKVVLITGGAAGIGLAYTKELIRNGVKAITIADIDAEKGDLAIRQINAEFGQNKGIFLKTDVTKADQLEAAFKTAITTWKCLDIVINNAGIMNDAQWELEIAINCNHVVRSSLLAMQYMGKNNGGTGGIVVNIASILGLQPLEGCPIYVGTKHFVIGLDRSFGTDFFFNLTRIKFLTMCPGVTDTSLISAANKCCLQGIKGLDQIIVGGLKDLPPQSPENVAQGMITLLTKGENGSVWVSEGGKPIYEVSIPDRQAIRK